jgi:hypothetical protein
MTTAEISSDLRDKLLVMQRDEITSDHMYLKLAQKPVSGTLEFAAS